jgi:hypothetical protein
MTVGNATILAVLVLVGLLIYELAQLKGAP